MKKYILIFSLILLASLVVFGASTDITGRPTSYWLSGNPDRDNAWAWMKSIDNNVMGPAGTGQVFYVDSGVNIEGAGLTVDSAKDTLLEGINLCTADRGDVVYVLQGHYEDGVVGTAAMWQASVSGVSIIGVGNGSLMPSFHYNYTSNTCLITADNVRVHNLRFRPSISAVAIGLEVSSGADDAHISNCDFGYVETTADEFAVAIRLGTNTDAIIEGCFIDGGAQAAVSGIYLNGPSTHPTIRNNEIIGYFSTANICGSTTLSTNVLIEDNILWNGVTAGLKTEPVIELLTGTVGISRRNYAACNLVTMNLAFVGDTILNYGNYYNESVTGEKTAYAMDEVANTATNTGVTVSVGY